MTVGPRAVQSKKCSNQLTWERKGLRCKTTDTLTRMPLKVVDSCTTRSASNARTRTWIHCWHILCTNIITMTHAINSSTKLLSIDITRTHILRWERVQAERKRAENKWETESKKRRKKIRKIGIKENLKRKKQEKKSINNLKINKQKWKKNNEKYKFKKLF